MARISLILLLIGAFVSLAAASAPTFCKCTCFKNSTIIPLGPEHGDGAPESEPTQANLRRMTLLQSDPIPAQLDGRDANTDATSKLPHTIRSKSRSCSECTKKFCLSQGIDFCKDAKERDVTTMCFQRDSNKDKVIVWAFIIGTVGLLSWTAFKRITAMRNGNPLAHSTANYVPVSGNLR